MKIREHPAIEWWWWLQPHVKSGSGGQYPPADIGDCTLKRAEHHSNPIRLVLNIEWEKGEFSVTYSFYDPDFTARLCKKLNDDCIGMSIRKIGDVEIDF